MNDYKHHIDKHCMICEGTGEYNRFRSEFNTAEGNIEGHTLDRCPICFERFVKAAEVFRKAVLDAARKEYADQCMHKRLFTHKLTKGRYWLHILPKRYCFGKYKMRIVSEEGKLIEKFKANTLEDVISLLRVRGWRPAYWLPSDEEKNDE